MATHTVTQSMQAKADALLAERTSWVRGRRRSDSRAFYLFASSDGRTAYYTAISGDGCTCKGYLWRGICAHSVAARRDFERVRAEADRPRKSLNELMDRFEGVLSDAF